MLPTRDSLQDQRPTQTESDGLEEDILCKWNGKKAGVEIVISDKIDFKTKSVKTDNKGVI